MFSEILKTECEQAKVFWEEYYKHVNKAHFSDGSDFDQTVMYPGELEFCFKADGDKVMSQVCRRGNISGTSCTAVAKSN